MTTAPAMSPPTPSDRRWEGTLTALGVRPGRGGKLPHRLTDDIMEKARTKSLGFDYRLRDGEVPGLALHVGKTGAVAWWLRYRAQDGKPYMFRIGGAEFGVTSARKRANEVLVEVRNGGNPAATKQDAKRAVETARVADVTMRDFVTGAYWTKWLVARKGGHRDQVRLLSAWPTLIDRPLQSITADDIDAAIMAKRGTLANGTILRDWSGFRRMLSKAFELKALPTFPIARRPSALYNMRGNERMRHVGSHSAEERAKFVAALTKREKMMNDPKAPKFERRSAKLIVFAANLAWATGMRRGEILGLRASEVGVDAITLPPHRTKTETARVVRLNDAAKAALKMWEPDPKTGEYFPGYLDDRGWDIPASKGGTTSKWRTRLDLAWQRLCTDAGIDGRDLHIHDLRHTFATDLRRARVQLEVVAKALGHADMKSTQRYAHVGDDEVAAAVAKVKF